jgi:hypothetical protein
MAESRSNGAGRTPQDFGETLGAIFARYPRLFATLLLVGALLGLLLAVTESVQLEGLQLLEDGELPGGSFYLAVIAGLVGNAYFWTVALLRADGMLGSGDGGGWFSRAVTLLLPVIGYMVLYVLIVMIGLVLLALPGIFLAVLLTPGVILIVLRDSGVFAAFMRSAALVWGSWWFSFGVLLTVTLVAAIPLAIAEAFLAGLRGSSDPVEQMRFAALNAAGMIVVLPLFASMGYTLLEALEARKRNAMMEQELLNRAGSR